MSSRQVNFYVHPDEQEWFEGRLAKAGPFVIVLGVAHDGRPQFGTTSVIKEFGKEDLKIFLVRQDDVGSVGALTAPNRTELFVDDLRSPVVEFSRCYFDGRLLRRGRLYFAESYYNEQNQLVRKPQAFVSWGRQLISEVTRSLERRADGDYVSARAREMERSAGVTLTAA